MTSIEWTDATWNPVVGCRRVSPGCEHCYAETMAKRLAAMGQKRYLGLVTDRGRWTGEARMVPDALDKPLRWRKPRMVFVNSMSDLFHEDVSFDYIAAVFGVMAASPEHTFQVLTKRPERMRKWFKWIGSDDSVFAAKPDGTERDLLPTVRRCIACASRHVDNFVLSFLSSLKPPCGAPIWGMWPPPNVWLGVSAEDQTTADYRIPLLLQCPAAVRFVSAEPLLGPIDISAEWLGFGEHEPLDRRVDWWIVGGESGAGARMMNLRWARGIVRDCVGADVPVFVKQLGSRPYNCAGHDCPAACNCSGPHECYGDQQWCTVDIKHRKGGDPSEWPEDLRVRQWPVPDDARIEEVTGG